MREFLGTYGVKSPYSSGVVEVTGPNFHPGENGLRAWNYDPLFPIANPGTAPVSQTVYTVKLKASRTTSVTNILCNITAAGSSFTSSSAAIYNSSGTKLQETASMNTTWNSTGIKTMAITSQSVSAGNFYIIAFRATATTMPRFGGLTTILNDIGNVGLGASDLRFASGPTGQTSMPSSITLSSRSNYSTCYIWAGLS